MTYYKFQYPIILKKNGEIDHWQDSICHPIETRRRNALAMVKSLRKDGFNYRAVKVTETIIK